MFGVEPLTGAYGRKYISLKEMQKDFDANKDFKCANGSYCSKADITTTDVSCRYGKRLEKVGYLRCTITK